MREPILADRICVFGKIPARADFIARGMSPATRRGWDDWLQQGMAACQRIHGPVWQRVFAMAPIWHVFVPAGLAGPTGLFGAMLPGFDTVGRGYPLFLGVELAQAADPLPLMAGSSRWFAAIEAMALDALDPGFDPEDLGRRVFPRWQPAVLPPLDHKPAPIGAGHEGLAIPLPMASAVALVAQRHCGDDAARRALFWTVGGQSMPPMLAIMPRLTSAQGFVALLDGDWHGHGWRQTRDAAPQAYQSDDSGWDRED